MEGLYISLLPYLMINDFVVIYADLKILQINLHVGLGNVDLPVLKIFTDHGSYLSGNLWLKETV